jgi:hypothetical protein
MQRQKLYKSCDNSDTRCNSAASTSKDKLIIDMALSLISSSNLTPSSSLSTIIKNNQLTRTITSAARCTTYLQPSEQVRSTSYIDPFWSSFGPVTLSWCVFLGFPRCEHSNISAVSALKSN